MIAAEFAQALDETGLKDGRPFTSKKGSELGAEEMSCAK
jgi:hypothetical protein